MDRSIVYTQEQGRSTDFLFSQRAAMIGLAKLSAVVLGISTMVNGLACTPTGPASMQVQVGPGEIYSLAPVDATAYGVLPADTTDQILKQGISLSNTLLSCPAPTTGGFSINYLVQVAYQDSDTTNVVLPYFNSANPSQPLSGQSNSGTAQATERQGLIAISVKAGTAAATGTQTTPAPDSGYTGLYVVTVANGAVTITSGNISKLSTAPILPAGLVPGHQAGSFNYAVDTGAANVYQAAYSPAITIIGDGMVLRFKAAHANTGASTFSPNGLTAAPIWGGDHAALAGGEIATNGDVALQWNSSLNGTGAWVIFESTGGFLKGPTPAQFDTSTKFATMAALARMGLQSSAYTLLTAATVLTAANAGATILHNSASNFTHTLPAASTMPAGTRLELGNVNTGIGTFQRAGSDTIKINGATSITSTALNSGDEATLVSDGVSSYTIVFGTVNLFGFNQSYNDVTASRALSTNYTNNTNKPIFVMAWLTSTTVSSTFSANFFSGATLVSSQACINGGTATGSIFMVCGFILPGGTYKFTGTQATLTKVFEYA